MNGPPPLRMVGPNTPRHVTVAELTSRLKRALTHPSITINQRDTLEAELFGVERVPDKSANWFIIDTLLEVEAMPRPANGGSRKRLRTLRMRLRKTLRMRSFRKRKHRK